MKIFKNNIFIVFIMFFIVSIFSQTSGYTYVATGLHYTPAGTRFEIGTWIPELTQEEKDYFDSYCQSLRPNAVMLDHSTRTYNCHGYAWVKSKGGPTCIVQPPHFFPYMQDGSYERVVDISIASKVYYNYGDHSAITANSYGTGMVISKWGQGPLMRHYYNYCPYSEGLPEYAYIYYAFPGFYYPVVNIEKNFPAGQTTTLNYPNEQLVITQGSAPANATAVISAKRSITIMPGFTASAGSNVTATPIQ
jgi:hypothetical protein